jgi:hypothetical protein
MAGPNNNPTTSGTVTTTTNSRNLSDGNPIGTTFGLNTADLISHYGYTCVVQFTQPGSPSATTGSAGSVTAAYTNTTYTGGVGTTAYSVGDIVTMLKQQGLLA